jgi:hypothetical protein
VDATIFGVLPIHRRSTENCCQGLTNHKVHLVASQKGNKMRGLLVSVMSLAVVQLTLMGAWHLNTTDPTAVFENCGTPRIIPLSSESSGHVVLQLKAIKSNPSYQPEKEIYASKKLFQDMPEASRKTFFAHSSWICHVMTRALRELGWTRVNNPKDAQLIWTYARMKSWYKSLEPWQRYNHVPRTYVWNHKDRFAEGFRQYQKRTGADLYFLPETFNLNDKEQVSEFKLRLLNDGGVNQPWVLKEPNVNQGKGITMLAPNSDALRESYKKGEEDDYIIQQYICNEMTWSKRKFDTRMYWFVASTDPLVVFYIDGYARIGNANYKENDFNNTRDHLTTHTFLGEEGKGSFDDLAEKITERYYSSSELQKRIQDPVVHVRNQYKEAIGRLIDAFKDKTFRTGNDMSAEDCFELYGADFVIDNDLDVWLIEPQDDCGMDGKCLCLWSVNATALRIMTDCFIYPPICMHRGPLLETRNAP